MAMMVDAIPVAVFCTAIREEETPRKGPNVAPSNIKAMAGRFPVALPTASHRLKKLMSMAKPIMPAMTLICVAEKGS